MKKLFQISFLSILILFFTIGCNTTGEIKMKQDTDGVWTQSVEDKTWSYYTKEDLKNLEEQGFYNFYYVTEYVEVKGYPNASKEAVLIKGKQGELETRTGLPAAPPTQAELAIGQIVKVFMGLSGIMFLSGLFFIIVMRDFRVGILLMGGAAASAGFALSVTHVHEALGTLPVWFWIVSSIVIGGSVIGAAFLKWGWLVRQKQDEEEKRKLKDNSLNTSNE